MMVNFCDVVYAHSYYEAVGKAHEKILVDFPTLEGYYGHAIDVYKPDE